MSRDGARDTRQVSGVTTDRPQVKYPFEFDGRWVLRYHVPYTVEHDGRTHRVVATIFAEPSVHGRIQVNCEGLLIAEYDELVPGSRVEITGDVWRVTEVEYRTRVVLERGADDMKEETGAQAGE
ncbi:hypothetical protein GCM10017779_00960 [Streptomyces capillispiralis]|uniref:Uncharacterized protein n=1 Tax=Streptomyces capillispiralis TaxID=68182 RepID=A0A561TFS6_9ACTN|nr:hypothetical protein FHX78_112899 [Streptomyces capillispiralis]GHH89516.1 hypothetical protein GCM10017779_00960 [Streptomyces capillispiralis]